MLAGTLRSTGFHRSRRASWPALGHVSIAAHSRHVLLRDVEELVIKLIAWVEAIDGRARGRRAMAPRHSMSTRRWSTPSSAWTPTIPAFIPYKIADRRACVVEPRRRGAAPGGGARRRSHEASDVLHLRQLPAGADHRDSTWRIPPTRRSAGWCANPASAGHRRASPRGLGQPRRETRGAFGAWTGCCSDAALPIISTSFAASFHFAASGEPPSSPASLPRRRPGIRCP